MYHEVWYFCIKAVELVAFVSEIVYLGKILVSAEKLVFASVSISE